MFGYSAILRLILGTGWIVAHAHPALPGFSSHIEIAAVYFGMQKTMRGRLYFPALGNFHSWFVLIGFISYWVTIARPANRGPPNMPRQPAKHNQ